MIDQLRPSTARFLKDIETITRRMERAQEQITSGLKISNASDAPDQISSLLQLRSELNQNEQIRNNLARLKTEVDAAEKAVQSGVKIVDRALVLGTQGANGTLSAETRMHISNEIGSLLQMLVGLSQATVDGRYIFSGDADATPPYSLDFGNSPPLSPYAGAPATRQMMHPNGTLFSVSKTAQEIFDGPNPGQSVFAAMDALRVALANDDSAAILAGIDELREAATYLNVQLAFYGTVQNQVAEAQEFSQNLELRLRANLASLEEADLTEAILELQQSRFQLDAALTSRAQLPRTSLFDYLR
ncbi:MAG: flagellin [Bryobacteraceae bacterium]